MVLIFKLFCVIFYFFRLSIYIHTYIVITLYYIKGAKNPIMSRDLALLITIFVRD